MHRFFLPFFVMIGILTSRGPAQAVPVITSPAPTNGASPAGPFVFVFSEPMAPTYSGAAFVDGVTFAFLPTTDSWSAGNTVLTCTPTPSFPANRMVFWQVDGENPDGEILEGTTTGIFT